MSFSILNAVKRGYRKKIQSVYGNLSTFRNACKQNRKKEISDTKKEY
jgi:hypothetical protein